MRLFRILSIFAMASAIQTSPVFAEAARKSSPELLKKGEAAYKTNCLICHGEKGDGNGPAGAMMNPKPRSFAKDAFKKGDKPEQIFETISKGLEGTAMASFSYLPEEDRWGLAYYVLKLKKSSK